MENTAGRVDGSIKPIEVASFLTAIINSEYRNDIIQFLKHIDEGDGNGPLDMPASKIV